MRKVMGLGWAVVLAMMMVGLSGCAKKASQETVPESVPETPDTLSVAQPKDEPPAPAVEHADSGGNIDMAKKLLDSLYETYIRKGNSIDFGNKDVMSKYFNSNMVELLYSESKCKTDTGNVCRIDWNILCACKRMPNKYALYFSTISVKPVMMLAHINYVSPAYTELLFTFTEENGFTKISDIITVNRKGGFMNISDTTEYGKLSLKEFLSHRD